MQTNLVPTELILSHSGKSLGKITLDWMPQPGQCLDFCSQTYKILERHHQYQYRVGGYILTRISLYVQRTQQPREQSIVDGQIIIGDANCKYNAQSELLRCAVNPQGLCADCVHFEPI
ncbi:MAG: hypothetical protein D6756_03905 [Cyanobacteria bacterium J083]|nr:MAG: hypothetical protein D6756_03905 [Cyanobacteria bacterium J083]